MTRRIALIYSKEITPEGERYSMNHIRWLRVSQAFARAGYAVDVIFDMETPVIEKSENLRYLSKNVVNWKDYDVVKTCFHKGFNFLHETGGSDHPFIISKLGSVVGSTDQTAGVYFYGKVREELYATQQLMAEKCKYVTILTQESIDLWHREFGNEGKALWVPTGADTEIPAPKWNPYSEFAEKIVVYIGNIYDGENQREVNLYWQARLNMIGKLLKERGLRLCFVGSGLTDRLDSRYVTNMGPVKYEHIYDYHYFADVALVFAQGELQDNESSKIYYYLRTGLPVVSEEPVPNNHLIRSANLGFITPFEQDEMLAENVAKAMSREWDKEAAIEFIKENHTWDHRVQQYDTIIRRDLRQPKMGPESIPVSSEVTL